jgi:hypothetical protein
MKRGFAIHIGTRVGDEEIRVTSLDGGGEFGVVAQTSSYFVYANKTAF